MIRKNLLYLNFLETNPKILVPINLFCLLIKITEFSKKELKLPLL